MAACFSRLVSRVRDAMEARSLEKERKERDRADLRLCQDALALWLAAGILQNASARAEAAARAESSGSIDSATRIGLPKRDRLFGAGRATAFETTPADAVARAAAEKGLSLALLAQMTAAIENPGKAWAASLSDAMRCGDARWHADLPDWAHEALDCVEQMSYFPPSVWRANALSLRAACESLFPRLASHWAREERDEIAQEIGFPSQGLSALAAAAGAGSARNFRAPARRL